MMRTSATPLQTKNALFVFCPVRLFGARRDDKCRRLYGVACRAGEDGLHTQ